MTHKKLDKTFTIKYGKGHTKILVAQCVEIPSLIVQGKTVPDLLEEMADALRAFYDAFGKEEKKK